jgi:hypothetical protein
MRAAWERRAERGEQQGFGDVSPLGLRILLLGETDRPEFCGACRCLEHWGTVYAVKTFDAALARLTAGEIVPDVMVVAQAFPGQFSCEAIDRLRRLAPLARVVGLMGSLCEGEMRTGLPWPGVVRAYWHQWTPRTCRELSRLAHGRSGSWSLPPTATEEERLLVAVATERNREADGRGFLGTVLVHARSREMGEWLAAACADQGWSACCRRELGDIDCENTVAAIYDIDTADFDACDLQGFVSAVQPVPVIALMGFPRESEQHRVLSAGVAAVLSKPLMVEDLFWTLETVKKS